MKLFKSKIFKIFIFLIILNIVLLVIANILIHSKSKDYIYQDIDVIPKNKVGLVLGTSKKLQSGNINLYYKYRIDATKELYDAGKIEFIVVSGDNSRKEYNEAEDMKNDLVALGIPPDHIYLDYAGFRTLDSVVRMEKIFEQKKFTIISQKFHNERAVFIARYYNLEAIGFNAKDVSQYYGFKTMIREKLARVKVFIDFITDKQPKFLGNKIKIE